MILFPPFFFVLLICIAEVADSLLSPLQLVELQTSFDALQMKFVTLMREKADLLDMLEEHKLLLVAAAERAEAIGRCGLSGWMWSLWVSPELIEALNLLSCCLDHLSSILTHVAAW